MAATTATTLSPTGESAPMVLPSHEQIIKEASSDMAPLLKNYGPIPPQYRIFLVLRVLWFGTTYGLHLLLKFLRNPSKFMSQKDRSSMDQTKAVPGTQHEYLDIGDGIRLHAVSLGRQPGKPLMLFLHGFPECWYSWKKQLQQFSKDYDAVAIDMRGFNLSSKPQGVSSYKMATLAADVVKVVQKLGHQRCVLVAHDWGGVLSWIVAGMYPQVVDRLVVMAGPHLGLANKNSTSSQNAKSWYMSMHQWPGLAEWAWRNSDWELLDGAFRGPMWGAKNAAAITAQDVEWYKHANSQPGAITGGLNYYRALFNMLGGATAEPAVYAALRRRLRMPVLAMMAENDSALEPCLLNNLDQVAETSEFHIIKDCSHWVPMDAPEEVAQHMNRFLAAHPPTPPASRL